MSIKTELNLGEIKVLFQKPVSGKITFSEMGIEDEDLVFEGGHVRMVFDFEGIGEHHYFRMPTIEVAYKEEMGETHWQCDFNDEMILDKYDHHGRSTVILMNRKRIADLEHRHRNALVVHAEFPKPVHLLGGESYVNFFN